MILDLEEVMDILNDEYLTEKEAEELTCKLEVISSHIINNLLEEALINE